MFDGICEALHRELDTIDNKLMGGKAPMSSQDLDNIDKMAHALKSLKTYMAMEDGYYKTRSRDRYYDRDYDRRY